jgi:hypothetical protein
LKGDGEWRYQPLALAIVAGHGFAVKPGDPPEPNCVDVPGYPVFLATVYRLSTSDAATVAAQLLLELGTLWLLYLLARRGSKPSARLAVGIAWVCPMLAVYSRHVLAGPLAAFLSMLYCLLLVRSRSTSEVNANRSWAAAGFCGALLVLVRVDAYAFVLLTAPFVALWDRLGDWAARRSLGVFALSFLLGLAPWTIRQYVSCGVLELPGRAQYARAQNAYFDWLDTWLDDPRLIEPYGYHAYDPAGPLDFHSHHLDDEAERVAARRGLAALKQGRKDEGFAEFDRLLLEAPNRRSLGYRVSIRVKRTALTWLLVPALVPSAAGRPVVLVAYAGWSVVLFAALVGLLHSLRSPSLTVLLFGALAASRTAMPFVGGWAAVPAYLVPAFPAVFGLAGIGGAWLWSVCGESRRSPLDPRGDR